MFWDTSFGGPAVNIIINMWPSIPLAHIFYAATCTMYQALMSTCCSLAFTQLGDQCRPFTKFTVVYSRTTEWPGQYCSSKHQWTHLQCPHNWCWKCWQPSCAALWVSCGMWGRCTHTWYVSLCLAHSQLHNQFWVPHGTVWLWVHREEWLGHSRSWKLWLHSDRSSRW